MLTCVSFWLPSTIVVLFVLFMTIRTSTPGSGDPTDPVNKSESTKKYRHEDKLMMGSWTGAVLGSYIIL